MPHYTADDATSLSYTRSGTGAPLLCLPGGPLRDPAYLGDLSGLANYRDLIIPELRKDRVDHLVADIEALRRELGLDQVDLLAHSAGANLALLYAAAHPARISRLVLVTPSCSAVDIEVSDEDWDATLAKRSGEPWFAASNKALDALFEGSATAEDRLAAARLWHGPWTEAVRAFCAAEEEQRTPNAIKIYYPEDALNPAATIEALRKLAAATLILAGDLDPMCTPTCARELAGLIPAATVAILPGCGHSPWVEFPGDFIEAVTSFLAEAVSPAGPRPDATPPKRIELGDILLRAWEPDDLQARLDAVVASFEPLHQWMDWAAKKPTLEEQRAFGEQQYGKWPSDGSYNYGIFDARTGAVLGAAGMHDRVGPDGIEIGYWCHVDHTGRGVITRAAALLTRAAFDLTRIDRVEIHCDEANERSAAVARRLGYRLDRIEEDGITAPAEVGRGMFWIMDRAAFAGSAADLLSR